MKRDIPIPLPHSITSFFFFFFSKNPLPLYISLFLTEMNPPLSGQISDETRYTLAPPRNTQMVTVKNQINPYRHHSSLYLFLSLFLPYLSLVFRHFLSLYTFFTLFQILREFCGPYFLEQCLVCMYNICLCG